jgi:ABC-type antimicrobial peptide transport system permease subunit
VIAAAIRRIDADVVASPIRPLGAYVSESLAPRRFSVELMALFAVAAMLLAVSGIYAVTAYAVGQRERELSVRVALGATRSGIVRLILGDGARALAIGLASGLVLAAVSARLLTALLFGVAPTDPAAFVQAGCAVAGAALLASVIPALRAANRTPGALGSD